MADTGLSDIMSSVFGGVSKMLTGKKFPQNVRALRMVAEEALRGIIQDKQYIAVVTSCKFSKPKPARVKLPNFGSLS